MSALHLNFFATIAKEDAADEALHVSSSLFRGVGEVIPRSGNEDCFAASEEHQLFALSDGASESYDSGLWSKLLCLQWIVGGGTASKASLHARIRDYTDECQPNALSWSKRAAFERGSYATFLGVRRRRGVVQVLGIGDSLAVWHHGERTVSFPYDRAEQFDERPLCLSTLATRNIPVLAAMRTRLRVWPVEPGSKLLLMTDALGRWLLSQSDIHEACKTLIAFSDFGEFARFVRDERESGGMKRDDTTLAVLSVEVES